MNLLETIANKRLGLTAAFFSVALYTNEGLGHNGIENDPGRPDPRVTRTVRLEDPAQAPYDSSSIPSLVINPLGLQLPKGLVLVERGL